MTDDPDRSQGWRDRLQVPTMLRQLDRHGVQHVVGGSVALIAWGARLGVPGDLDITPALDDANLDRLAAALEEVGAWLERRPDWTTPAPEGAAAEQARFDAWTPRPATEENLDVLVATPLGYLDVVPRLYGTYAELASRAVTVRAFGVPVEVMHFRDLDAALELEQRLKDGARMSEFARIRELLAGPERVTPDLGRLARPR